MWGLPLLLLPSLVFATNEQVTFTLGGLGEVTGNTVQTKTYPNAPHSNRPYYRFRNLPYAQPFQRFHQSQLWDASTPLSSSGPYDATKTGPLCHQGIMDPDEIEEFKNKRVVDLVMEVGGPIMALAVGVIISLLNSILELDPSVLGPITGTKKVGAILHDWLDIDLYVSEECLHLAVSTPTRPDGTQNPSMPVMFFVHGGAFYGGTQIRMGAERLGAWDDVVVVAINYRVGPLGFMCLDTDEAAGNMGMLDQVTALEWVHQYISYFGGDPNRVTIFGESAGSASIGHLLLSDVTTGLFAQGIGQSGSALASWAFDAHPEQHALEIASKVGCIMAENGVTSHDDLVACLRELPATNISHAFNDYMKEDRLAGGMGFGGSIPCAQTKGEKRFYTSDQTPEKLLHSGHYEKVPIMFGANSHEGSFVYATVYNSFLAPNNYIDNEKFLRQDLVHQLLQTVEIGNSYPVEYMVEEAYFQDWQMGDLEQMRPGIIDMLGVFFLKASSYEFVTESADQGSQAYWYSLEYASPDKSAFHALFSDKAKKANITDPGVCHGDELIYLFNLELPLALCDISLITAGLNECLNFDGITFDMNCIEGEFRDRWHWCITGELTEEENLVSGILASMWTQFAVSGNPGHGAQQWTREDKWYSKITTSVQQAKDYHLSYHFASEGGDLTTTTAAPAGSCPENWQEMKITQDSGEIVTECLLLGGADEFVTKQDAALICSAYGASLVELSDGSEPMANNFIKILIHEASDEGAWFDPGPRFDAQWWIGATCSGHHNTNHYGNWTWDESGKELEWFDWLQDEPNDYETQNCLAFVPNYNNFGSYNIHWNDLACDDIARFICMKRLH